MTLRALTLWRPWDEPVGCGFKPVENRPRPPPASLLGEVIAIHAGLHYDQSAYDFIAERGYRFNLLTRAASDARRAGKIVALARIAGWLDARESGLGEWNARITADAGPTDFRDGPALRAHVSTLRSSPWWMGPVGILLVDVRALREPVPCRGAQGYWTVPADVEALVRARVAA